MMKKIQHHPTPVGANLSSKQIDEVAKTIYNRYYYEYGMAPQYNECDPKVRKLMHRRIKEVLDALDILGFTLNQKKDREDVGREFLTKSTVK